MEQKIIINLNQQEFECALKEYILNHPDVKLNRKLNITKITSLEPQDDSLTNITEIQIELSELL